MSQEICPICSEHWVRHTIGARIEHLYASLQQERAAHAETRRKLEDLTISKSYAPCRLLQHNVLQERCAICKHERSAHRALSLEDLNEMAFR